MAGIEIANHFYSEVDVFAESVFNRHFPTAIPLGDIRDVDGDDLRQRYPGDWVITGGFPCQDVSHIGKRKGIEADSRSGLWHQMHRLIDQLRPRFVLIENVRGLCSKGLDEVLRCLARSGYDAEWQVIRACDQGRCHNRQRVWIVAYPTLHGFRTAPKLHTPKHNMGKHGQPNCKADGNAVRLDWRRTTTEWLSRGEPLIYRANDGISTELHESYRQRVKALGNAIVPVIAADIFERIKPHLERAV